MGKCYRRINFMIMGNAKIKVESASDLGLLNSVKTFNDFCNKRGTFSQSIDNEKEYFWHGADGEFVHFFCQSIDNEKEYFWHGADGEFVHFFCK